MRISLTLIIPSIILTLASCGNSNTVDYNAAANELCECMNANDTEFETGEINLDTNFNMNGLNYSMCVVGLSEKVDIRNEQMEASITEVCPELSETHFDYVKSL